ncbi:hypothetical protein SAMN05444411_1302 [Lutibacter oricola]|uniref:CAAX prenyl protease 2/Lysostaphin resistance protein A-like domain-containing protein n=1 Tax=Lutibacter oricola TaxID=762486 RepID=A0A1H3HBV2_9FLAO|nr:type II CAAX endopeptidase family protein [Lutibacter oricola]SDY12099.1 hypothetical protein SAMN05444411_1302 [Lutibacter oricola]
MKNYDWLRILYLILPYFIIVGIFQFIGVLIAGIDVNDLVNKSVEETSFQKMIISFFDLLGTFFVIWIFMKLVDKKAFVQLGFQIKKRLVDIVIGLFLGAIIMILAFVGLNFIGEIVHSNTNFDNSELLISIATFTIVAFVEETLFRGYILRNLMSSFNKYIALIISSILFSLMHGANPNIDTFALINLFLAGILLGATYIHTKNLWFPIALHLSWNLAQTLVGFNVSGQDVYSIIEFTIADKNVINGGDFGFEGTISAVIVMILMIIAIEIYYRKKKTNHNNVQN